MWRYDAEISEDVMRAANALENIQLDRKARNLTTSWRLVSCDIFCHITCVSLHLEVHEDSFEHEVSGSRCNCLSAITL